MGRKSSKTATTSAPAYHEAPGCFNGIWNGAGEADDTPVIARKSLSERKFSEGFEAPRNSLDIGSVMFESARRDQSSAPAPTPADEIPFGFEFALRKSVPPRVSVHSAASSSSSMESGRCRSPSVIARLMGLETLPAEQPERAPSSGKPAQGAGSELQAWKLMSERRELLTSRSNKEHRVQEKPHCLSRQLSSSRVGSREDEFLLFDVLPFRDHPQEKQLEKLKQEFQASRRTDSLGHIKSSKIGTSFNIPELLQPPIRRNSKPESKDMVDAIQFLQSNKDLLVKFLQEPNSVFARHVYDLPALVAKEASAQASRLSSSSGVKAPSGTVHQDNIGFSRKLVNMESKKDHAKPCRSRREKDVVQRQRKDSAQDKIILLKPNVKKQSTSAPCSGTAAPPHRTNLEEVENGLRRSKSFKDLVMTSMDPRTLARQIARQARENVEAHEEPSSTSSRRYIQVVHQSSTASLPNSPKLLNKSKHKVSQSDDDSSSRELFIQIELTKNREAAAAAAAAAEESTSSSKKHKGGKLLKLFTKDVHKTSSADSSSPRLLVRSRSVPGGSVEEKADTLERTHSCKQSTSTSTSRASTPPPTPPPAEGSNSKGGKFSSLKTSLLGKKKGTHRTSSEGGGGGASGKGQGSCKQIEHSVSAGYEDHYTRTFRETEAQLATSYQPENKFTFDPHSPSYLSVDVLSEGLDHLDASSDIHMEKSEQPSPVSVLERGFIEESPSPVSFEDVSSDLQELQMRLERLKLDESGRTYSPGRANSDVSTPPPSTASIDELYIAKLMHASGFSKCVSSLYNWHSPSCPIDPYLFGKLEEEYSSCGTPSAWQGKVGASGSRGCRTSRKLKIGRSSAQVERRPETLNRQMLFDVVNEVLSRKFEHLWNEQPWHEIGKQGVKAVGGGKYLVREVVREVDVYRHEYDNCEYPLENLVERDVNRGSQWMDTRDELRKITSQVEASILDSLVQELAASLIV